MKKQMLVKGGCGHSSREVLACGMIAGIMLVSLIAIIGIVALIVTIALCR